MTILRLGAVAGVALMLASCGERETDVAVVEDPAVMPPAEAPPAAPAVAEQASLQEVAGSGVTGEIQVTPRAGETHVVLMLQNAPPNESLGSRVHSGTCESPGPELASLDAVSTDGMGQGRSETSVGHAPHLVMDGNHIVAVHRPGADPERDMPIACATIPASGMATQPGAPGGY